jgi:hypothetical protein
MNKKEFTIPNILQQLSRGRTIVYQPNGEDSSFKMIDTLLKDSTKSRLEFVFFEKRTRFDPANRLNFVVDLNKAMIIRFNKSVPLEGRLPPLFTMFALLENVGELETVFQRGYQFLSLIRCHAATLLTHRAATGGGTAKATRRRKQRGGGRSDKILGTDAAITFLYGPIQSNNRRRTARRRRGKN